jgi:Uncharacterized protein conserved in bacteria
MFDRLQSLFQSLTQKRSSSAFTPDDPRVAVAALCLQVMEADGVVHRNEKEKLRSLLKESYELSEADLDALLAAGKRAENEAIDYYRFTADLKRHLDAEERRQLVAALWDLVYSDGKRSEIEDHVVWRIADLLGVSSREHILERQDAAVRARTTETGDAE